MDYLKTEEIYMDLVQHLRQTLTAMHVKTDTRIVVGVSGGVDSMVLLYALHKIGLHVTAAHVNFRLRDTESDEDAAFVRQWCAVHNIPFLLLEEDTKSYAARHALNTQLAARKIRYDWWEQLRLENGFDFIATAHQQDDQIETVLLNLLRGTGIKGLRGIPAVRDFFIRPLLDIPRLEIESFAASQNIPFRVDRSNESDAYLRNRIRHHLVPLLQELSPGFYSRMNQTSARINLEWNAWIHAFGEWEKTHVQSMMNGFRLTVLPGQEGFMLRWLEARDVPWNLAYDFIMTIKHDTGKLLSHGSARLSRTADGYFFEITDSFTPELTIESTGEFDTATFTFSLYPVHRDAFVPKEIPGIAYISGDAVIFPLQIRGIKQGDAFQPLGMPGKTKKIQDLLVDRKLERHEKDRTLVLANPEHILWVIDQQLDDRAKVKSVEKEIYLLKFNWKM